MESLSKAFAVVSRTVQSASELLRDKELRDKGIQTVISGAQSRLQGLQNGIVQRAGRIGERLQDRQRQLASLLATLEERLYSSQRTWQLQASRRQRVDVQLGRSLFTDAPQEVRARLWYVLLENPNLAAPIKCQHPGPVPNRPSVYDDDEDDDASLAVAAREASARSTATGIDRVSVTPGPGGGINTGVARAAGAAAAAAAAADADGSMAPSSSSSSLAAVAAAALGFGRSTSTVTNSPSVARKSSNNDAGAGAAGAASAAGTPLATRPRIATGAAASGVEPPQPAAGDADTIIPCAPGMPLTPAQTAASASTAAAAFDVDGWELVGGAAGLGSFETAGLGIGGLGLGGGSGVGSGPSAGAAAMAVPEAVRIIMERLEALGPQPLDESQGSDPVAVAQQAVLEAMLQVPWEAGEGLPADVAPDSRFAMLNEMTAGQEEVDDSILRDIHRTFPEHPYFGLEAGQRSLFRVLKAYSLHDLEVAYCQGMAFMAGVLLMYVPEEMAFRLFCRLMDGEGPNLRRLYLPGLEPLKAELATFELLLSWRLPELGAHLAEFGLPPVLYVSQWLMTLFATPFPPPFCARVIDVLLQDGNDRLLLRCSYAVMEALEPELLARHDFEALITYLKMEPVSWGLGRQRAIFESALASPITDAEIEVARDTVASRHLLAAALGGSAGGAAAGAASGGMGTGGGAGGGGAGAGSAFGRAAGGSADGGGGGGGGGADELAASSAAGPLTQLLVGQSSFKKEVDAALAMAAAAGAAAEDGTGGSRDIAGGAAGPAGAGGAAAAAGATARGHGRGGDMIALEDEGDEAPAPGSAAAAAAAAAAAGIAGLGMGSPGARGAAAAAAAGGGVGHPGGHGIGHGHGHSLSGGRSAAIDAAGAPGSHPHPHSRHHALPPPADVMDELPGGGGAAAAVGADHGQPAAAEPYDDPLLDGLGLLQPPRVPELDGEYGEMLMDAGLLLPEVGGDMAAAANAGGGGADGFGILDYLGLGGEGAGQRPAGGGGNGGAGDLLLD